MVSSKPPYSRRYSTCFICSKVQPLHLSCALFSTAVKSSRQAASLPPAACFFYFRTSNFSAPELVPANQLTAFLRQENIHLCLTAKIIYFFLVSGFAKYRFRMYITGTTACFADLNVSASKTYKSIITHKNNGENR